MYENSNELNEHAYAAIKLQHTKFITLFTKEIEIVKS